MTLSDHTSPGQMAGFLFQPERALFWLAKSERGSRVGIETEDDIVLRAKAGHSVHEQDKHSINPTGYSLGNRSKDLWKTLKIWLQAVDNHEVVLDTTEFYLVTNKILPSECLAKQIGTATTEQDVSQCIQHLREVAADPPEGISQEVNWVLQHNDNSLVDFISKIRIVDGSESSGPQLREAIISHLHIASNLPANDILQALLGWVHETTMDLWRNEEAAWLTREAFDIQFNRLISIYQCKAFVEIASNLVPIPEGEKEKHQNRLFVKQLLLLSLEQEDDLIVDAINDYIRCVSEITRFSKEGSITKSDVEAFMNRLHERWKIIFRRYSHKLAEGEIDQMLECSTGFDILFDTLNHRENLAGQETQEYYLTRGSYHRLADDLLVGWHPRFEQLVSKEG